MAEPAHRFANPVPTALPHACFHHEPPAERPGKSSNLAFSSANPPFPTGTAAVAAGTCHVRHGCTGQAAVPGAGPCAEGGSTGGGLEHRATCPAGEYYGQNNRSCRRCRSLMLGWCPATCAINRDTKGLVRVHRDRSKAARGSNAGNRPLRLVARRPSLSLYILIPMPARRTLPRCCGRYGWTARQQRRTRWAGGMPRGLRTLTYLRGSGAACEAHAWERYAVQMHPRSSQA